MLSCVNSRIIFIDSLFHCAAADPEGEKLTESENLMKKLVLHFCNRAELPEENFQQQRKKKIFFSREEDVWPVPSCSKIFRTFLDATSSLLLPLPDPIALCPRTSSHPWPWKIFFGRKARSHESGEVLAERALRGVGARENIFRAKMKRKKMLSEGKADSVRVEHRQKEKL